MGMSENFDAYEFDVGAHTWEVMTKSLVAAEWFRRGCIWSYAFNHEEAVVCFKRAVEADPDCVMGYFGLAWASSPNYNVPSVNVGHHPDVKVACQAIETAMKLVDEGKGSELEQALVRAMATRFVYPFTGDVGDRGKLDECFKEAMYAVYEQFPDHPEVTAIYAESLMQLSPWNMYDAETLMPNENCVTVTRILEEGLEKWPRHPGLCHYYIHVMEMSPNIEKALPAAATLLEGVVPSSGHLLHMPSHIYTLLGRYGDAISANKAANVEDDLYEKRRGSFNFYVIYRMHVVHFIVYSAMFSGQFKVALDAAEKLVKMIPVELLYSPAMVNWLESYVSTPLHVLIRFGMWTDILRRPLPEDREVYSYTTAVSFYARTIAHAALGNVFEAEENYRYFESAVERVQPSRRLFQNACSELLKLAAKVAKAEVLYRKGEYEPAFTLLEGAVKLDDNLNYDEPWGWMLPARHVLGALLTEQKQFERAEKIYRRDLQHARRGVGHPKNIWSLSGLATCLAAKGDDVDAVAERKTCLDMIAVVEESSDVKVKASCMCATALAGEDSNKIVPQPLRNEFQETLTA